MMKPVGRGRQFIQNPGPTNIPDAVLEAFRRPSVDFDSPEFNALIDGIWNELPVLFGGAHGVVVLTSVGHGAWESALVNLLAPGDQAVFVAGGLFGMAWGNIAKNLGYKAHITEMDIRRAPGAEEVHELLAEDTSHQIKAVCVAQTETSTGTVVDIPEFRAAIDAASHPAFLVVDAIGSFGTEPMPMADWGVDVVLAASQKAMMMPPGLAFCAISERALEHSSTAPTPAAYWAWPPRMGVERSYMRFGGTPPEQHVYALRAALDMINTEGGIDAVVQRHHRYAKAVHACVEAWGKEGPWELNATQPSERAAAVTCVRTGDIDADELRRVARSHFNITVGGGMLELAGRAFRIGHLGELNEPMLLGALGGLEATMDSLGHPHGPGVSVAAAALGGWHSHSSGH
jgi:alanine-glyoxylate transaminase/serine-glyoxylate transaminase/serine-pyruvate transaminase